MIVSATHTPNVTTELTATVAWLGEPALSPGARVVVKHTTRTVKAIATRLHDRLDVTSLEREADVGHLAVNEIGTVTFTTAAPLAVDPYTENRLTGSFIVIDESTNATLGAGMVVGA
jgi:sulfate adenylyltransferase subunit 1 (EFTu-like GTPase family)